MAEEKRYYWLQFKEDFFRQKEIKMLRKIAGGDTYTIIYQKMMLMSLKDGGKIYYEGVADNFAEEVALEIDEEFENVRITITYLIKKGLLVTNNDAEVFMSDVPNLIGSETDSARRVRKHRSVKQNLLHCNTEVTKSNTDIDIDKDKDIDIDKKKKNSTRFAPPTLEEIKSYCTERNNKVDANKLFDFYTANGWVQGKGKPIKDWKACVRTWESNSKGVENVTTGKPAKPPTKTIADLAREQGDIKDFGGFK